MGHFNRDTAMFEEMDTGTEALPLEKVDVKNRLGFMDLEDFCRSNGFSYYIAWYPGYAAELSCQENLGGHVWGEYGEKMQKRRLKFKGEQGAPTGIAGRALANHDVAFSEHASAVTDSASDAERTAAMLADECGVVSSWAIWRDGAVYEFGSPVPLSEPPYELIAKIGGSTGVAAAAKAVIAVVKLGSLVKSKDAKGSE